MTIIHSKAASGIVPRPQTAGAIHFAKFTHVFDAAYTASGNILELGVLPPYARIADYKIIPEGSFGGVTCSAGIMTGRLGDDGARSQGTELAAATTALTAAIVGVKPEAFDAASSDVERAIGFTLSGDVSASASKKITLLLQYYQ